MPDRYGTVVWVLAVFAIVVISLLVLRATDFI